MTIKQRLRSGEWVTPSRIRGYSILMLLVGITILSYLAFTAHGIHDYAGRVLGTDFSNVYAAGTYVRDGMAQAPFDPELQFGRQKALFGAQADFYGWHYPPYFLLLALPLAAMPYLTSLIVYQLLTFGAYLIAMRKILPRAELLLPAIGFGAVVINMGHGNNGFLTAALFIGGLAALRRRPLLAGVLLGCLIYKPQYGIYLPLVLAAGAHWRAFISASLTVVTLTMLTVQSFGVVAWQAFFAHMAFTRTVVFEAGDTGFYKMQSLFAWLRYAGAPMEVAYMVQTTAILLVAVILFRIWRSWADASLKAAALIVGTLIAVPYGFDYDLMLLAGAIAFYVEYGLRNGFPPYAKSLLAFSWLMPFLARPVAQHSMLFLGPVCLILLFSSFVRECRECGRSPA